MITFKTKEGVSQALHRVATKTPGRFSRPVFPYTYLSFIPTTTIHHHYLVQNLKNPESLPQIPEDQQGDSSKPTKGVLVRSKVAPISSWGETPSDTPLTH